MFKSSKVKWIYDCFSPVVPWVRPLLVIQSLLWFYEFVVHLGPTLKAIITDRWMDLLSTWHDSVFLFSFTYVSSALGAFSMPRMMRGLLKRLTSASRQGRWILRGEMDRGWVPLLSSTLSLMWQWPSLPLGLLSVPPSPSGSVQCQIQSQVCVQLLVTLLSGLQSTDSP